MNRNRNIAKSQQNSSGGKGNRAFYRRPLNDSNLKDYSAPFQSPQNQQWRRMQPDNKRKERDMSPTTEAKVLNSSSSSKRRSWRPHGHGKSGGSGESGGSNEADHIVEQDVTMVEAKIPTSSANSEITSYQLEAAARTHERANAEQQGLIAKDAIEMKGTCERMCSIFEMKERELRNNLDRHELGPDGQLDPRRAVKAYKRPDASAEAPLPSDLRPGPVLKMTLDYLFNEIVANDPTLADSNGFVWDRTRSIRQDFSQQGICDPNAVECHERIARYHILALHQLSRNPNYSAQQEREQLGKTLKSLMEYYDDLHLENILCPNEAEFRAYFLLFDLANQDFLRRLQTLPMEVFFDPRLQRAIELHSLAQRNNEIKETGSRHHLAPNIAAAPNFYTKFFKMIRIRRHHSWSLASSKCTLLLSERGPSKP